MKMAKVSVPSCIQLLELLMLCCLGSICLGATPDTGNSVRIDQRKKPAYWRDQRLAATVSFPEPRPILPTHERAITPANLTRAKEATTLGRPRPIPLISTRILRVSEFAATVKSLTRVRLVFAGEWNEQFIALPMAGGSVRELMDGIAEAYDANWYSGGRDTWVLAGNLREVSLALLSANERNRRQDADIRDFVLSLSPEQWISLTGNSRLSLAELTPRQRNAVIDIVRLDYYSPEDFARPAADALTGRDVRVELTGSGRDARLHFNQGGWAAGGWDLTVTLWNSGTGNWTFGFPPPR